MLDCIDSWSLPSFLLRIMSHTKQNLSTFCISTFTFDSMVILQIMNTLQSSILDEFALRAIQDIQAFLRLSIVDLDL